MRKTARKQTTTRSTFWYIRMISEDGDFAAHPGWVVRTERPVNRGQALSREQAIREMEEAIEKIKALGIDNGPDGEFAGYPEFSIVLLEWNGDTAELY